MANAPKISRSLPNRINLSHARQLTGRPIISAAPRLDATGDLQSGAAALQAVAGGMLGATAGQYVDLENTMPIEPNRDPWRTRIFRLGRTRWERFAASWGSRRLMFAQLRDGTLPLGVRFDILRAGRPLTPEEMIDVREQAESRRLFAKHRGQAELARRRIISKLTLLNYCDSVEREGRRVIRGEVELKMGYYSPNAYVFYVTSLPRGVKALDIADDAVCTDLSLSVGHPVRADIKKINNVVIGLRYTVEIAATLGVPNLCRFGDLFPMIPPTAPPLAFLLGYAEGSRVKWVDLEKMPHLLGGGETNGGKSNMMHGLNCSLISRNTPATLRMAMIDLKFSGIELRRYEGLPHLIAKHEDSDPGSYIEAVPSGIAIEEHQATAVLEWALAEAERRGKMFTKAGAQDLRKWNRKRPTRRLPYIVIVCDELGQLRLNPDTAFTKRTYVLLQKLLAQGRAAGISFVAFTQSSNKRVLDELSKINLPGRICFSTPDTSSSVLFVGDGSARGLTPAGRAIFKHGTEKYLVQTPLIQAADIDEIIANARAGKLTTRLTARSVTPEELIEWAVEHNQSSLAWRDIFSHFGGELQRLEKQSVLDMLRGMENHEYRVNDHHYRVLAAIGSRPRVLQDLGEAATMAPVGPNLRNGTENTNRCAYCGRPFEAPDASHCAGCGAPRNEQIETEGQE